MNRITFKVEFATPAFLGGANGANAEWRAGSIRGQLHWWFRAVAGANLGLDAMRSEELRLFGSTHARSLRPDSTAFRESVARCRGLASQGWRFPPPEGDA